MKRSETTSVDLDGSDWDGDANDDTSLVPLRPRDDSGKGGAALNLPVEPDSDRAGVARSDRGLPAKSESIFRPNGGIYVVRGGTRIRFMPAFEGPDGRVLFIIDEAIRLPDETPRPAHLGA